MHDMNDGATAVAVEAEQTEPSTCRTCWNQVEEQGAQCRACREESYGTEGEG